MKSLNFSWLIMDKNKFCLCNYIGKTNKNSDIGNFLEKKAFKNVE